MPRIANPMTLFAKPMSLIAKLGFPPVLCLVSIILFTCGKDSPTNSSRPGAAAPRVAVAPDNAATTPKSSPTTPKSSATTPKSSATTPQTMSATPHSISIVPDSIQTIFEGRTTLLRAVVRDRHGIVLSGETIAWSSSDSTIASVSSMGIVKGLDQGAVRVAAKVGALSDSVDVLVSMPGSPVTNETASGDPQPSDDRRRSDSVTATDRVDGAEGPEAGPKTDHATRQTSPPDYVIQSVEVSETHPSAGQRFSMSATVKNQGGDFSGFSLSKLRFYMSTDATISRNDTEIGSRLVSRLDADETREWSLTFIKAPSTAGTYYYGACIDPQEEESDKLNNCSEAVTLSVGGPDLVIESVTVSETSPNVGQRFSMSATVKNQGAGATFDLTRLRFYTSTDATISTGDTEIGNRPILPLDADETREWSLPFIKAPSTAGTYYYGACVDPLEEETDKLNNCSEAVTVSLKAADLIVERATVSDFSPTAGGRFSLSATVRNQGGGDTSEWTRLRFYQSEDAMISTGDSEIGKWTISPLKASASQEKTLRFLRIPLDGGTYYYGACVEPVSGEDDTGNNCSIGVTIAVSGPDLIVESPAVSENSPAPGEAFDLRATVRNQGGGDAASSTTLQYYRSSDAAITSSDTVVGTDFVKQLAASESAEESISLNAPSTAGTYYYGACVDALANESSDRNNCSLGVLVAVGQTGNRPPAARGKIPDQDVDAGESVTVDVSSYFSDPDGDPLSYRALTSNAAVATAFIPDRVVTIRGESAGNATITITASDGSLTAARLIRVTVRRSVTPRPDLIVESPTVSDGNPDPGGPFTLGATVRNRGDGDASSSTTLRYYRSADATISASDTEIGSDSVISLDQSDTSDESIALTAPANTGTYYYGACVDPLTDESNTQNNCSVAVTVTAGQPVNRAPVAQGTIPPQNLDVGESVRITVSSYFRDPEGDRLTYTAATSRETIATATTFGRAVTVAGVSAGNATITVTADDGSLTARQAFQATIRIPVTLAPDLIVETPTVTEASLSVDERFTLSATVRNQGDGNASSTRLRYYRSTDATITSADTEIGDDYVSSLRASATSDEIIFLRAPATFGTYYYGACVDALSEESDTGNNCSVAVMTTVNGPDLVVGQPTVSNNNPQVEEKFTLSVTVRNRGAGDAASSTTLRYYRSADATITSGDTEVGTDNVFRLDAAETGDERIVLTASDAGTYYYGACVDAQSEETNTLNNCSGAVSVEIREKPTLVGADSFVYLTQSVQSVGDPVPLIEGDEALLRVFIARDGNEDISIPPVRATFYHNGSVAHEVDIPARSSGIPETIQEGELELSSNALIPGSVIEPGLEMVVEIDPDGTLDSALDITQRIPPTGRTSVDVRTVSSFDIMIVPYLWDANPDRSILTEINNITADGTLLRETRDFLPVGDVTVSVHDPVSVSYDPTGDHAEELLTLTESIRGMEKEPDTYYLGVLRRRGNNRVSGLAYVGGWLFGLNKEYSSVSVLEGTIIAHEFGHNLSLRHAPCGGPADPDSNFPDSDGSIGAWGYDFVRQQLVSPDRPDLMGYCDPAWVSYYNFNKALNWRRSRGARVAVVPSATRGLLLWGHVNEAGDLVLEPAFAVEAPPVLPETSGPYQLTGESVNGDVLFDLSFDMKNFADVEGGGFNFILPVRADWTARLHRIILSGPEGVATQDREGDRSAALLLDSFTGQVRGFLRDWAMTGSGRPPARRALPEPGLEIIVSPGVPDSSDW